MSKLNSKLLERDAQAFVKDRMPGGSGVVDQLTALLVTAYLRGHSAGLRDVAGIGCNCGDCCCGDRTCADCHPEST